MTTKHDVETVKYIGIAKIRRILATEWQGAGIKGQDGIEFNELNGWTISGEKFTKDAIKVLSQDDGIALLRKGEREDDESG